MDNLALLYGTLVLFRVVLGVFMAYYQKILSEKQKKPKKSLTKSNKDYIIRVKKIIGGVLCPGFIAKK